MAVMRDTALDLKVGDVVEVRSEAEILATLDENGELDSLPFMPEMLRYCGRRMTVYKVAHKLCDTIAFTGMRKMTEAVHLREFPGDFGVRCDGSAHDGCQQACLIFWKHAWLRKVADGPVPEQPSAPVAEAVPTAENESKLLPLLVLNTKKGKADDGAGIWRCQGTEALRASPEPLPLKEVGQIVQDVRTGNVSLFFAVRSFVAGVYNRFQGIANRKLPPWLRIKGGRRWGAVVGTAGKRTPGSPGVLKPGDLVRIKSREEVGATLNENLLNRGLGFDAEMARFCGRLARVERHVSHIIDEKTGRIVDFKTPTVVLEGIYCEGAYSLSCPRAFTPYFREAWLEKVDESEAAQLAPTLAAGQRRR
jgi:hypothetical protein